MRDMHSTDIIIISGHAHRCQQDSTTTTLKDELRKLPRPASAHSCREQTGGHLRTMLHMRRTTALLCACVLRLQAHESNNSSRRWDHGTKATCLTVRN